MPTPETIEIDSLIAPIPGDNPAGGPIPFALKERLDQARKEINPNDFDPRDPLRPADAKVADWGSIITLTSEGLTNTSKDLLLVARLIEALTKLRGFTGLRDGVRLARRLVEDAWDRLRPEIEEPDDLEVRASPFHWLDDADRGARFPSAIRSIPFLIDSVGPVSWIDWSQSRSASAGNRAEEIEKAVAAASRDDCQTTADNLDEVIAELQTLLGLLNDKMGSTAPSLTQVRQAVFECRTLAHQMLDRKGPAAAIADHAEEPGSESSGATGGGGGASTGGSISKAVTNRAQAYQRLVEVADALQALEPHSPIPYIVRRAVELGQLPFPDLIKALITDQAVLVDLSRNLGIKELEE